jgi:hypothetical protein
VVTPLKLRFMMDPTTSSKIGTTVEWWRLSRMEKANCGLAR